MYILHAVIVYVNYDFGYTSLVMNEKALLLSTIDGAAAERLREEDFEVNEFEGSINPDAMLEQLSGVDILGVRTSPKVLADVIDNLPVEDEQNQIPYLKAIGVYSVGVDKVDVGAATNRGIPVFNSPYANSNAVAEWGIGSIFSLARNFHVHNLNMHGGEWIKTAEGSREVSGAMLGILGKGGIGDMLREKAMAVGMTVQFQQCIATLGWVRHCSYPKWPFSFSASSIVYVPKVVCSKI